MLNVLKTTPCVQVESGKKPTSAQASCLQPGRPLLPCLFKKKFLFLCVPSVLLPALSFFCFVLFCEWRQISSSAVLRRSVLQGISWLIHRLEPVTHPSCTSCRTQRRCNPRFLGGSFFFNSPPLSLLSLFDFFHNLSFK